MATPHPEDTHLNGEGQHSPPFLTRPTEQISVNQPSSFPLEHERLKAEKVDLLYSRSAVVALSTLPLGAAFLVALLWS